MTLQTIKNGMPKNISEQDPMPTREVGSYATNLTRGILEGVDIHKAFFEKGDLSTMFEDLCQSDMDLTYFTEGETIAFKSDSVNDTNGGTGAHSIEIIGLDENYLDIKETVILNGTTPVSTTKEFFRVNRMHVFNAGSLMTNDGVITGLSDTNSIAQGIIPAGEGTMLHANYTAGAEGQLVIIGIWLTTPDDGDVSFKFEIFGSPNDTRISTLKLSFPVLAGFIDILNGSPMLIPAKHDFRFKARRLNGTGNNKQIAGVIEYAIFKG